MTVTDTLLFLVLLVLCYLALALKGMASLVERIAGKTHYQQQEGFSEATNVPRVKRADYAKVEKPVAQPTVVDLVDLPEEQAIQVIENWSNAQ